MRFQIVIICPPGYAHSAAFAEVADTLAIGFRRIGHPAEVAINAFRPDAVNVVLGMHLLPPETVAELPARTVMYNLEQVETHLFEWAPQLRTAFERLEVWDYSPQNIERLRAMGLDRRLFLLPVGMVPELTRIPPAPSQDIDVLFYGVVSERRRVILKAIQDRGLTVAAVFGFYGARRDGLIARAKLVINLHKQDAKVFEVVRVSYLLANRKAVVTELTADTAIDDELRPAVAGAAPDDLPDLCRTLIDDPAARHALEQRGYQTMSARRQEDYLRALLAARAGRQTPPR